MGGYVLIISFKCVCVCVRECWCGRIGNYVWQLFESWGSPHNPGYRAAWSLLKTVTHPDSAHLWGLACFVHQMTEFCLSEDLFVWLQSHGNNISELTPKSVISSVDIWVWSEHTVPKAGALALLQRTAARRQREKGVIRQRSRQEEERGR